MLDVDGSTVVLGVRGSLAKRLSDDRNVSAIAAGCGKVVAGPWRVTVRSADGPRSDAATGQRQLPPEPDPRDDADYEPATQAGVPSAADPEAEAIRLVTTRLDARPL